MLQSAYFWEPTRCVISRSGGRGVQFAERSPVSAKTDRDKRNKNRYKPYIIAAEGVKIPPRFG